MLTDHTPPHHWSTGQTAQGGETLIHSSSTNVLYHPLIHIFNQLSMIDSVIFWIRCPLWTECWRFEMNTSGPSALDLWYDRIRLFGSNGKGQRPTPVLLFAFSVWPVATDVLVAFWFFLSPGSTLKVKANFKVEPQTCWQKSFTKPSIHQSPHQRNVWWCLPAGGYVLSPWYLCWLLL